MSRIAVDAMGGDRGPEAVIEGALAARGDGIEPVIFGAAGLDTRGLELVETTQVVGMDDKPADVLRTKEDSSLVRAVKAVADGEADAVVSPGNTGAMLAAGLVHIRRLKGVRRPAIAVPIPAKNGPCVLVDAGANADCRPEHLLQFATMGAVFAEEILGLATPTVRLLSIGEEAEKGNQLTLETHALLAASDLNFQGNAEGRDILEGAADVLVTDGFTGNVALKTVEGTIRSVLGGLRSEIEASHDDEARRPAHPPGRAAAARAARSGHVRRRLPPRSQGPRRHRARQLVADRDRECDPPRGPRRRARRRRHGSLRGCPSSPTLYDRGAFRLPNPNEVTWQLRARKSPRRSRKS